MQNQTYDPLAPGDGDAIDPRTPDAPEHARLVHLQEVRDEFSVAEGDPDMREQEPYLRPRMHRLDGIPPGIEGEATR